MGFDLKSIADRTAIRDVLERYCRGIDRLDAELVNSVYWDEANDNHGIYNGPARDFVPFVMPMLRDNFSGTMHCLNQSLIELNGKRANAETYFVAYHWRKHRKDDTKNDTAGQSIEIAAGRYVDVFEERGDEWRIRDRVCIIEWGRLDKDVPPSSFPLDIFEAGRRDQQDIAYRRE